MRATRRVSRIRFGKLRHMASTTQGDVNSKLKALIDESLTRVCFKCDLDRLRL